MNHLFKDSPLHFRNMSWKDQVDGVTVNVLPFDFVNVESRFVESTIEVPLNNSISSIPVKHAALDIFTVLIARWTGDEQITLGAVSSNGNPALIRATVDKTTTLAALDKVVAESFDFADKNPLSATQAVELFTRDVFRASFGSFGSISRDLNFSIKEDKIVIKYNALLYKQSRVKLLAEQFNHSVDVFAKDPSCNVLTYSLITPSQKDILPDPQRDLDWCNFRGAIQDIFNQNAQKHPDRECVVETANPLDPNTKTRSFTYKQINEASNQVAHYLIQQGIVNDDVVVIYAYRGVDLVIAVMGVLKAGATFSVIDPAYPPSRQNIYLSVAKPKGIIFLRKAGVMNPTVREYIDQNLTLKSSLENLELQDDGSVVSTNEGLDSLKSKASTYPGVVVGPDSHPTLSFTSGSEGIPKGVRGRHFSLAYYFPWMAKTFGISENDKFTMLSGIAHDPIQRDIFTPLFLGARLMVPCADDIGTPGRLAEWVAETGATVTHLTPAMGQLLSAQATEKMPSLRLAFFVGDILTKRDCTKLQTLAQNTDIINMYGTTETQRAVSYFRVPSVAKDSVFLQTQKDTIPAGSGMLNVQMLVVNRNDRTKICGVGEVGEIYVRAGGLSDGYLGLPDMTAEKFVTNWFVSKDHWKDTTPEDAPWRKYWLGPRDRLYRSGDLGRYLPDGNVECSGRADDQVKIRGFRIELGEINTHISRHPAVRENVTLVRRDKDEEPILVAYVVPESKSENDADYSAHESLDEEESSEVVKGLVRYRRLVKSLKEYLKTKLPSYAVPSVIVPLQKLPLNPNGKIDKPRLPFPDTAQLELVSRHLKNENSDIQFTKIEEEVKNLWLEILPTKPPQVEPSDSFFDLGGHSILATKMIFKARSVFGCPDLPLGTVFEFPTIKAFAKAVEDRIDDDDPTAEQAPTAPEKTGKSYGDDADELLKQLPKYQPALKDLADAKEPVTIFLTGVTGFLGSFLVRDLLDRKQPIKIIAHVRAKDAAAGMERLKTSGRAYGTWNDKYEPDIEVLVGNLEDKHFGLGDKEWNELAGRVDGIIHNGALVHWVYPYEKLRGPNVIATINIMELCAVGKPKSFTFVSSTSVVDTEHYVDLSDEIVSGNDSRPERFTGIPESDDLEGSRNGLGTGYGQSKWVCEYLIRHAGNNNGLSATIVRPGYITGDSKTGISNTDDFLLRMLKGSQELGLYPNISNTVNQVPVDHVARLTAAVALNRISKGAYVAQVTSHPRIYFNQYLGALSTYGYDVKATDYVNWRVSLEQYVVEHGDNALFPLLHFVLDNLPQNTKAPELDDRNSCAILKADAKHTGEDRSAGSGVSLEQAGVYLAFLVACGFMVPPQNKGKLPKVEVTQELLENFAKVAGRNR